MKFLFFFMGSVPKLINCRFQILRFNQSLYKKDPIQTDTITQLIT